MSSEAPVPEWRFVCMHTSLRAYILVSTGRDKGQSRAPGSIGRGGASEGGAYQTWASHAARSNHRHPVQYSISTVGSPGSAGSGGEAGRSDAAGLSPVPQRGRKAKVRSLWQMALCRARKVWPVWRVDGASGMCGCIKPAATTAIANHAAARRAFIPLSAVRASSCKICGAMGKW